ncbi:hypothetical protein [Staphylococcus capitis]|uniref:hypothetical protein n=1 Tax=Staphylococcus capitis TaxID=29388 RepID=UPI00345BD2F1
MRIFKTTLGFLTLSILTTLFVLFCLRENEELIPNSKYIVAISEWDHKVSKEEILKTLNTIAKKENISLYKPISTLENKNKKGVYIFNEKSDKNFKYIVNNSKINKMSYEDILKKDIRGKYFVTQKYFDESYLVNSLSSKGLKAEVFKVNRWLLFLETVHNHFLLIPIVSIIVIYLLYYIHEKNKKFKEISIKTLNGYSFLSILFEKLYLKIAYWIIHFIIQFLCALTVMFLIRSNNIYNPKIHNYNPYSGNILYVNQNFLKLYSKDIISIQTLLDKPQTIEIILPKEQAKAFHKIKDEFIEWSYFQNEFKKKLNIEVINSKNNNNIFSYDNRTENSYKFLRSPVIVILNSKDLADDFYYASLSQGAYLFKNYNHIEESLNRLHLKNYVSGITSYTDSIEKNLRGTNIKLIIVTFSGLLLMIVGIITIIFDIQYYFEQNKKDLLYQTFIWF